MAGKLTQRDRNNIILRFKRNEKISDLAKRYEVSRQTISHLIHEYQETGSIPQEKKAGRKRVELSESEKELIRNSLNECHMKADRLEVYIRKKTGRRISHNKIHSYLLSLGISFENARKKKQRKYRKYQRGHSMTLWHTDWKEFRLNGERKYLTVYIDDMSRFITCYGVFDEMTCENSLTVLKQGIEKYGCPEQIVTDNGAQYCTVLTDDQSNHEFGKFLKEHGIRHIRSRVHHPQTNGKVERFFKEVEDRIEEMESVDALVDWQNRIKPHMGLNGKTPEYIFWRSFKPERIMNEVKEWFWKGL